MYFRRPNIWGFYLELSFQYLIECTGSPSLSSPKKSKFLNFQMDTIATSNTLDIVI